MYLVLEVADLKETGQLDCSRVLTTCPPVSKTDNNYDHDMMHDDDQNE